MSYINKFRGLAEVAAVDLSPSALEKFIDRAAAGLEFRDVEVLALIAALEDARAAQTASEVRVRAAVFESVSAECEEWLHKGIPIISAAHRIATRAAKQLAEADGPLDERETALIVAVLRDYKTSRPADRETWAAIDKFIATETK